MTFLTLQITGNNHSKARLSKKWQNINYTNKVKSVKVTAVQNLDNVTAQNLDNVTAAQNPESVSFSQLNPSESDEIPFSGENNLDAKPELSADSGSGLLECKGLVDGPENIWSAGQNALRDLLLFLIQKHNLEEVSNPKTR